MHLDEEQIERLKDGELAPASAAVARAHLAQCADCRQRLEQAEREEQQLVARLARLDHPAPALDPEVVISGIRRPAPVLRWAAMVLLGLGIAGAAYAIPGSPLPGWLHRILAGGEAHPPAPVAPDTTTGVDPAGIALDAGAPLVIEFPVPVPQGTAEVVLVEQPTVELRAPQGSATFSVASGRVVVQSASPGLRVGIAVPYAARRVEIRVAGRQLLLAEAGVVTTRSAPAGPGRYLLQLEP